MSKLSQCLKIYYSMLNNLMITKKELAEYLETSPRNIKAYIDEMRQAGISI